MKKSLIFKILYLFLVLVVVVGASVFATNTYLASQVSYGSTNVEDALNGLFKLKENTYNYSTDEQIVGKWIDNKPIYRKITYFNCSITSLNGKSTGITNGDLLINSTLFGTEQSGYKWLMTDCCRPSWFNNTLSIIYTDNKYNGTVLFGIFEYTKTTD